MFTDGLLDALEAASKVPAVFCCLVRRLKVPTMIRRNMQCHRHHEFIRLLDTVCTENLNAHIMVMKPAKDCV